MSSLACPENITQVKLLQEVFASATHDASVAMCRWTNSLITLSLDDVCECSLAEACLELHLDQHPVTMVVLNLEGDLGGTMVLMFTDENGRRLASSLLQTLPSDSPDWTEMEASALAETGNILSCAYVDAITRLIDCRLVPSAPEMVKDSGISALEQAIAARALGRDGVLICRTGFHCESEALSWRVLFIPTPALRSAMENAIHTDC
jgi:chemotaxis protein CheC